MPSYLDELYLHQEWADARHWQAIEAHPPALEDRAIRERLHHIHLVQAAFLWVVGPRTTKLAFSKLDDFPNMSDLKAFARKGHLELAAVLGEPTDARLAEMIDIPWFPRLKITVRHALMQAAMHSHYHRGQNATRLRELGGVPPATDFIVWLRDGQPKAEWD